MSIRSKLFAASIAVAALSAVPLYAQPAPPDGGGGQNQSGNNNRGGGGGGGRWNPEAMRQRMMDNLKEKLGATDDEFQALQPKIEKVMQLARDTSPNMGMLFGRGGRNGGPGGPGGGPGRFGGGPPSDVQQKREALATAAENPDTKPEDLKAKLDDVRTAEANAKQELAKAQDDLKGLLTPKQEAVLAAMGLVD